MVEVSGTISPVAVQHEGTYKKETFPINKTVLGAEGVDTVTYIDLGDLEFYKGSDMVFDLVFKNVGTKQTNSKFSIDLESDAVTLVDDGKYSTVPKSEVISVNGRVKLTFALHLEDETQTLYDFSFVLNTEFEEVE